MMTCLLASNRWCGAEKGVIHSQPGSTLWRWFCCCHWFNIEVNTWYKSSVWRNIWEPYIAIEVGGLGITLMKACHRLFPFIELVAIEIFKQKHYRKRIQQMNWRYRPRMRRLGIIAGCLRADTDFCIPESEGFVMSNHKYLEVTSGSERTQVPAISITKNRIGASNSGDYFAEWHRIMLNNEFSNFRNYLNCDRN